MKTMEVNDMLTRASEYISPESVLMFIEAEGVLCGSVNGDNDPFEDGGTIETQDFGVNLG